MYFFNRIIVPIELLDPTALTVPPPCSRLQGGNIMCCTTRHYFNTKYWFCSIPFIELDEGEKRKHCDFSLKKKGKKIIVFIDFHAWLGGLQSITTTSKSHRFDLINTK